MGPREDEVRERMARDADILRGLGQMPDLDDLRGYLDELNDAALEDAQAQADEAPYDYEDRDYCDKERGT